MPDDEKPKTQTKDAPKRDSTDKALIFLIQDARDTKRAEAFRELLTSVSAGASPGRRKGFGQHDW